MRVLICENQDEAADVVAEEILSALEKKKELILGLATGSTPIRVYERLLRAHSKDSTDFSRIETFNLDEYVGLSSDHPQSYRHFMRKHLFDGLAIDPARTHFPPTDGLKLTERCQAFEALIQEKGGIDIQLLGIGGNGHIGFNEPTSSLASRTRLKTLTEKTMSDNARFYHDGEEQPRVAATMGIGTILSARKILLQAFGKKKAQAVHAAVEGPISSFWPASVLQHHPDTTFFVDEASASELTMRDYYRQVRDAERDMKERGLL